MFHHQLKLFYSQWQNVTTDKWILEIIATGYMIPFQSLPPPKPPTQSFRDPSHKTRLKQEVDHLIFIGVVERVPEQFQGKGFYSRYFLREKKTGLEANPGPTSPQPACAQAAFQDGYNCLHTYSIGQWRLVCSPRLAGRVFSYNYSPGTQTFPPLHSRQGALPIQSSSIQSLLSTQSVHQNTGGSISLPTQTGCVHFSIPGRLPTERGLKGRGPMLDTRHYKHIRLVGPSYQPLEIKDRACAEYRVHRGMHRLYYIKSIPARGPFPHHQIPGTSDDVQPYSANPDMCTTVGAHGIHHVRSTECQGAYAGPTTLAGECLQTDSPYHPQGSVAHSGGAQVTGMVGKSQELTSRGALPPTTNRDFPYNRRIPHRMGSAHRQQSNSGAVVPRGKNIAHKHTRGQSSVQRVQMLSEIPARQSSRDKYQHHYHHVLYQPARRGQIPCALCRGGPVVELVRCQQYNAKSLIPTRCPQHEGGPAKQAICTHARVSDPC
ncbi:uncharacterized protein LOC142024640 isoform X1 [Carettochelys insculpta]|uniref:uncharacterized protein LOC142024640 isoform X1 n=1 Tax=Carettochelys insculpta TaxID=44489 RepID=UPI003EBF02CC